MVGSMRRWLKRNEIVIAHWVFIVLTLPFSIPSFIYVETRNKLRELRKKSQ